MQGENQFRWANIEVDDSGSVSNWSTRIDAEDFNLEKFNKAGNKVIVYYDAINELYSIDGRLNFDNGILINLKTDNENRVLVENLTFNESLEIDGWSVSGGTIFERLREIGLMKSIPFASEYDGQQDNISLTEPFTFNNTADGEEAEISRFTLLSGEITVDELELNRIQQGEDSGQGSDELDGSAEDAELTEETSETNWTIGKLEASGDLAVEVAGFDIESNIDLSFHSAGTYDEDNNQYTTNTAIISNTVVSLTEGGTSIFDGEATINELVITQDERLNWQAEKWTGSGKIAVDTPGIDTNSTLDIAYYSAGTTSGDVSFESDTITTSGTFKTGNSSLFKGKVQVDNLTFEEIINEDLSSGDGKHPVGRLRAN